MDMTMTSKDSAAATANASTHHHQQQQEGMGTAVEDARNVKKPRQQAVAASGTGEGKPRPDEALECPRCKSRNTKFCYYNNYNTSQPRYLCKACRRFWTQGGILRNVPVGSGYRKKRSSASLSSSSSSINEQPQQHQVPASSTTENDFTTSFDFSGSHLPFPPPALSSLAPAPPLLSGAETPSFLDMLRGGFLDYESNGFYGSMSSDMETLPFGHGAVMQNGVVGDHGGAAPIGGEGATAASTHQGGQWPTTEQVGTDQQQKDASVPDNAKAE